MKQKIKLTGQLVQHGLHDIVNSFNLVVICGTVPIIKVHLDEQKDAQKVEKYGVRLGFTLNIYGPTIIISDRHPQTGGRGSLLPVCLVLGSVEL